MDGHSLAEVVGALGIFAFVTTVITVIVVQVGATVRARAALAREDEYRRLASSGADTQRDIERQLGEICERLTRIEKILKTVE
ncbi:hypothetical protein FHR32_001832 [Streptosporangium album]|uniref:Uncharacterized protein n=1 Tax=Streptosporangium album TaxID=47479 RepID=A0A7W7W7P5_9ACTN|nr:hypothetical protein [Streptosporangium album]MBB4937527.1 hypothetical protein [Streptosporangium album]